MSETDSISQLLLVATQRVRHARRLRERGHDVLAAYALREASAASALAEKQLRAKGRLILKLTNVVLDPVQAIA